MSQTAVLISPHIHFALAQVRYLTGIELSDVYSPGNNVHLLTSVYLYFLSSPARSSEYDRGSLKHGTLRPEISPLWSWCIHGQGAVSPAIGQRLAMYPAESSLSLLRSKRPDLNQYSIHVQSLSNIIKSRRELITAQNLTVPPLSISHGRRHWWDGEVERQKYVQNGEQN